MRILFLYPSLLSGWASYRAKGNTESSYFDHGFAMLSAILKNAGHECFSMDLRSFKGWEHFEQTLLQQKFDLTLTTFFSANEKFARQSVEIVKRNFPNKLIIGGGVYLSVTKTKEYPNIDTIIWGEGEPHILNIVEKIQKGEQLQKVYDLKMIENMDELPYVDRGLFNRHFEESSPLVAGLPEPMITIVAGRGCFGKCTFCYPSRNLINGNKCRIRSVDHFLGEIIKLHNENPIGSIMIHDDLLGTTKWMDELILKWKQNLPRIPFWCQLRADVILRIKDYIPRLAEIGLSYVSIGLESGSQRMLDFLHKGTTVEQNIEASKLLHDNNINIFANYILGLPTEQQEDIDATEKMLAEIRPSYMAGSIYTSYEGSELYEWIKANNYWAFDDVNNKDGHYSTVRFPYERKIKGVDYERVFRLLSEWSKKYTGDLKVYGKKMLMPEIKIDNNKIIVSTKKNPLVSAIIVTYNRPEMLNDAIKSIYAQTYQNWELIVNDYTENWEVNRKLYDQYTKDNRVKWIRHEKNINNIAYCWNEALDYIYGDYWFTLDDDNTKKPLFIEKMVGYLQNNPDKHAVVCPMQHTGSNNGIHYVKPENYESLKKYNKVDSGQVLYRRTILELVGYFDEKLLAYDDWDYILRVYHLNNKLGTAIGWLDGEPLCCYSWHDTKRMYSKDIYQASFQYGTIVSNKVIKNEYSILVYSAKNQTPSQIQVTDNIKDALISLSFIRFDYVNPDLIFITGTLYNMSEQEFIDLKIKYPESKIVALLVEEPQALVMNMKFQKYLDYVFTNDINSYDYWVKNISDQNKKKYIYHWNCLNISDKVLRVVEKPYNNKKYDICFIGHTYPSRIKFIKELSGKLKNEKLLLIGDGWKELNIKNATCYPTLNDIETSKLAVQSRIVLLRHRDQDDLGGFPIVKPDSVQRGYIEASYGCVLMIDDARKFHSFDNDTVIFYSDVKDCYNKIQNIFDKYNLYLKSSKALKYKAMNKFTYRERMLSVLNCIRSERFNRFLI